jgi:ribosomal protein S18 acetylase RimI-like enzyme
MFYAEFGLKRHPHLVPSLIQCYRDVFAGEPWNEWKLCPACQRQYGIGQTKGEACQCGSQLIDFWPPEQVRRDLEAELTTDSTCWVAFNGSEEVIGFTWGYLATPEGIATKVAFPGVAQAIREFAEQGPFAYIDEIGVSSRFRRQGVAKQLYRYQLSTLYQRQTRVLVTRTKGTPFSVARGWFLRMGYQVIARYPAPDDRIILALKL